ncbi:SHOCT domain-containing protein [Candidatus Parcubacteria bacterium]|nr:SHOCT domain-containing protein [Candidatus Parcubacteria bacterium]
MGYKGTLRSVRGSVNRSIRASEREQKRQQRQVQELQEKFNRKVSLAEERRSKPIQKLSEQYAAGKIDKTTYDKLAKRDAEITVDLMIFGRGAGVKLAERYVTGKIDSEEFEQLKNELLGEPETERDKIAVEFRRQIESANNFVENARANKADDKCNSCGRAKKFYSPLIKQADFKLCVPCVAKFKKLCSYSGYNGSYYVASPSKLKVDEKNDITLNIVSEHILNYK